MCTKVSRQGPVRVGEGSDYGKGREFVTVLFSAVSERQEHARIHQEQNCRPILFEPCLVHRESRDSA